MSEQITIFEAIEKRNDAIDRGEINAKTEWKSLALHAIQQLCYTRREFTADDIWKKIDGCGVTTHDRRALGGVMRKAVNEKWCRNTMRYVPSKRRHASPIPVWESLIYEPFHPNVD